MPIPHPTQQQIPAYEQYVNKLTLFSREKMDNDPVRRQREIAVYRFLWGKISDRQAELRVERPAADASERARLLVDWYAARDEFRGTLPKQLLCTLAVALGYIASDAVRSDADMAAHHTLLTAVYAKLSEPN